jgi:PRTRC genetic system ThiF family protein
MLTGLSQIHLGLLGINPQSRGLQVSVWDGDEVNEANLGRQLFSHGDLGQNKAIVAVTRTNVFLGTSWEAFPVKHPTELSSSHESPQLLITCVDSLSVRRDIISAYLGLNHSCYWLDLGNRRTDGNMVLGWLTRDKLPKAMPPSALHLYPELWSQPDDTDEPSCGMAEALAKQDLFINRTVATAALNLLWGWFRSGVLQHNMVFMDSRTNSTSSVACGEKNWSRFNHNWNQPLKEFLRRKGGRGKQKAARSAG